MQSMWRKEKKENKQLLFVNAMSVKWFKKHYPGNMQNMVEK